MQNLVLFVLIGIISSTFATTTSVTNGYYKIYAEDGDGLVTLSTGSSHPDGDNVGILFGGNAGDAAGAWVTLKSYTSGTVYTTNSDMTAGTFVALFNLETLSNGYKSTYQIRGDDNIDLVVQATLEGPAYHFLKNHITFSISASSADGKHYNVGVRLVLDWKLQDDDGPTIRTLNPESEKYLWEHEWETPTFEAYQIESNRPLEEYLTAYALVSGQGTWANTVPDRIAYAANIYHFDEAWTFDVKTGSVIGSNQTRTHNDDSSTVIYWGTSRSISLDSIGNEVTVYHSFSTVPSVAPVIVADIKDCVDNYTCTYDYIVARDDNTFECLNIPISYPLCDDENPCTNDVCDPYNYEADFTGCVHIENLCSDEIACTLDWCNTTTGECDHVDLDCDDQVNCTIDQCNHNLGECENVPSDNACLPAETDMCHTYYCDPLVGCVAEPVNCDDDIPCTDDTCHPSFGCVYTPNNAHCDDNITCTNDVCEEWLGRCTNYPDNSNCDDMDPCTTDYCDLINGCVAVAMDCADPDMACTRDFCFNGTCIHIAEDNYCNDNNNCTIDSCDMHLGQCTNVPADGLCNDDQGCTEDWCDEIEGCLHKEIDCTDEIGCTFDYCDYSNGTCVHSIENEQTQCDDGIECTYDYCDLNLGRCNNLVIPDFCDDNDTCTTDICNLSEGRCVYIPLVCNDQIAATEDQCVNGECVFTPIPDFCDDGFNCTVDRYNADLGRCENNPSSARCNDDVACTLDICNYTDCINIPEDSYCEDGIPCTSNWCTVEGCATAVDDSLCDDGIDCTIDYCDEKFGCIFVVNSTYCQPVSDCGTSVCVPQVGCVETLHQELCDDEIDCTVDTCDAAGCNFEPMNSLCNDNVGCTVDMCNVTVGECVHVANDYFCDDGRDCSIEVCDVQYGCLINDTSCPVDENCEHCINCASSLSRIVVADLEDGSGDLVFKTRNTYVPQFSIASPVNGLTENLLMKGFGPVVFGNEEVLDYNDGLVIGSGSSFKLVPTAELFRTCNEITRGQIQVVEELVAVDLVDVVYICLKNVDNYEWKQLSKKLSL